MAEYLGELMFPDHPIIARGRCELPLQMRLHVYRSARWVQQQQLLNDVCKVIMTAACADPKIWPVRRYCQHREAFNSYLNMYKKSAIVQKHKPLHVQCLVIKKASTVAQLFR